MSTKKEVFVVSIAWTLDGETETNCNLFTTLKKAQTFMKEDFEECKKYLKNWECSINTLCASISNERGDIYQWNIEKRLIH